MRDFVTAKPACECVIKATLGHATPQELAELAGPLNEAGMRAKLSVLAQRSMPEIQACRDIMQKGGK